MTEAEIFETTDYGKRRLLTYADSFRELAESMEEEFEIPEEEDRAAVLESKRIMDSHRLLCGNLKEMAGIMDRVAAEIFRLRPLKEKHKKQLLHALKTEGIIAVNPHYIERPGERTAIGITMYCKNEKAISSEQAADIVSVILDRRMQVSAASPYLVDSQARNFVFVDEASFVVLTGSARAVKETEHISGDNIAVIESERGKLTAILSDGMGSGEKASSDSELILDLMEKLIEAGYPMEGALSLINSMLLSRPDRQNMSTLDICELDLYEGNCSFYKIGAAATFYKSDKVVEIIESPGLPLGIFPMEFTGGIKKKVQDGDYIIMMSDGVLDGLKENRHEETMRQIIESVNDVNPKEIARKILQFVLHLSGGHIRDDMTVLVLGIWQN